MELPSEIRVSLRCHEESSVAAFRRPATARVAAPPRGLRRADGFGHELYAERGEHRRDRTEDAPPIGAREVKPDRLPRRLVQHERTRVAWPRVTRAEDLVDEPDRLAEVRVVEEKAEVNVPDRPGRLVRGSPDLDDLHAAGRTGRTLRDGQAPDQRHQVLAARDERLGDGAIGAIHEVTAGDERLEPGQLGHEIRRSFP